MIYPYGCYSDPDEFAAFALMSGWHHHQAFTANDNGPRPGLGGGVLQWDTTLDDFCWKGSDND